MRTRQPLLSVITVVKDDQDGLGTTLESITQQQSGLEQTQIVVVDAASRDSSATVARSFLRRRDVLISEVDAGIYDGMNKGWRASSGRFVQFLNSGDTLHDSSSLTSILAALTASQNAAWFVGEAQHLKGGKSAPRMFRNIPHVWWEHAMGHQDQCHQACIFARGLLEVMNGYSLEAGFVADFDLILRCGIVAEPLYINTTIVDYEGGGISAQRAAEIPDLLRRVRHRRLGLRGAALAAEDALLPEHHRGAQGPTNP